MHFFEDFHDMALVSRARLGDMAALALLIQLYQRVLYTVALGMLGDADEAREATRAAFVRTCDRLSLPSPDYGFFSATHRLLLCECLEVLRRRPLRPGVSVPGGAGSDPLRARGLTGAEQRRWVHAAMLQGSIDGALDHHECDARDRLLAEGVEAPLRAAALNELARLLNSLGPADPPRDLALEVLSQVEALTRSH